MLLKPSTRIVSLLDKKASKGENEEIFVEIGIFIVL